MHRSSMLQHRLYQTKRKRIPIVSLVSKKQIGGKTVEVIKLHKFVFSVEQFERLRARVKKALQKYNPDLSKSLDTVFTSYKQDP